MTNSPVTAGPRARDHSFPTTTTTTTTIAGTYTHWVSCSGHWDFTVSIPRWPGLALMVVDSILSLTEPCCRAEETERG